MTGVDIISNFLRRLERWTEENMESSEGTELIRTIWKDDPQAARRLSEEWTRILDETGTGMSATDRRTLTLVRFVSGLDEQDHRRFISYVAENGGRK